MVLIIFNILVLLTNQAAGLNSLLASDSLKRIFVSEPGAYSDTSPEVLRGVLINFYLPTIIIGSVCGIVLIILLASVIINALSALGQSVINLIARRFGERDVRYRLLIIFGLWTLEIISAWLVLNIDETLYYLLAGLALMLVNLLLGWATQNYVVDEAQSELKQAKRAAKESA